jgi:hypothetical protein
MEMKKQELINHKGFFYLLMERLKKEEVEEQGVVVEG